MPKELSIKKLETIAVDALEDIKGRDIIIVNTTKVSQMFERIVLASGESNRQVRSLARNVADKVREAGFPKPRIEGEDNGEWIIVDCGAVVAHIMQPNIRQYYNLEEIWGEKPVRLKFGAPKPVKASAPQEEASAKKSAGKKPAAKKTAEKKPAAKTSTAKAAPAKTGAAKKPAAKPAPKAAAKPAPAPAPAPTPAATPDYISTLQIVHTLSKAGIVDDVLDEPATLAPAAHNAWTQGQLAAITHKWGGAEFTIVFADGNLDASSYSTLASHTVGCSLHLCFLGGVAGNGEGGRALCVQLCGNRLRAFDVAVQQGHLGTCVSQGLCNACANAAGCAGHHAHTSLQPEPMICFCHCQHLSKCG